MRRTKRECRNRSASVRSRNSIRAVSFGSTQTHYLIRSAVRFSPQPDRACSGKFTNGQFSITRGRNFRNNSIRDAVTDPARTRLTYINMVSGLVTDDDRVAPVRPRGVAANYVVLLLRDTMFHSGSAPSRRLVEGVQALRCDTFRTVLSNDISISRRRLGSIPTA